MNIALIAQNRKKELMVQFCIAYCGALSQHELCSTGSTGRLIAEATGLKVTSLLPGVSGGDEQIAARASYNELDMVLIFRDPLDRYNGDSDFINLQQLCDAHNIPFATNIATAEVLIQGLIRGDLAWRDIVNPKKSLDVKRADFSG